MTESETTDLLDGEAGPRPLGGLARHLGWAFRSYILFAAGLLISHAALLGFLNGVSTGALTNPEDIDHLAGMIDLGSLVAATGMLAALIWSIVMVCRWTFRAMKNLRLRGIETGVSPTMAVIWYFIPFASLIAPFIATQEIWRRTMNENGANEGAVPVSMVVWWLCWILGSFAANLATRVVGFFNPDAGLDRLMLATSFDLVSTVLMIVSALFMLRFVPIISRAQDDAPPSPAP